MHYIFSLLKNLTRNSSLNFGRNWLLTAERIAKGRAWTLARCAALRCADQ